MHAVAQDDVAPVLAIREPHHATATSRQLIDGGLDSHAIVSATIAFCTVSLGVCPAIIEFGRYGACLVAD